VGVALGQPSHEVINIALHHITVQAGYAEVSDMFFFKIWHNWQLCFLVVSFFKIFAKDKTMLIKIRSGTQTITVVPCMLVGYTHLRRVKECRSARKKDILRRTPACTRRDCFSPKLMLMQMNFRQGYMSSFLAP
jgi:hypothetical protein